MYMGKQQIIDLLFITFLDPCCKWTHSILDTFATSFHPVRGKNTHEKCIQYSEYHKILNSSSQVKGSAVHKTSNTRAHNEISWLWEGRTAVSIEHSVSAYLVPQSQLQQCNTKLHLRLNSKDTVIDIPALGG